ncbi:unnamed protein product [Meloidogyne enterolobii]|uniref:Uncharacterized protein n=1 Tax=Meloidogyne enterolobii TaxID=390850 RepID=A0ACB1A2V5_MELEN
MNKLPSSPKVSVLANNALFPPSDESDDEEKDVKVEHQQLPSSSSTKVSVDGNSLGSFCRHFIHYVHTALPHLLYFP